MIFIDWNAFTPRKRGIQSAENAAPNSRDGSEGSVKAAPSRIAENNSIKQFLDFPNREYPTPNRRKAAIGSGG
jgi:hypothetical protein